MTLHQPIQTSLLIGSAFEAGQEASEHILNPRTGGLILNVAEASTAPRVHHQWLPDELRVEEGISLDTVRILQAKGHVIALKDAMGSTQSIMRDPATGALYGASDPRRPDAATLGY